MSAGESAAEQARRKLAAAEELRRKAEQVEKTAKLWLQGEAGERQVVELLSALTVDGYFPLPDRRRPGSDANLDCVVVGPAGVVLVDAKNWSGALAVSGSTLRQNGYGRNGHLESLRTATGDVVKLLKGVLGPTPVPVWPVMCFVGEASVGARQTLDRVYLIDGRQLPQFVRSLPPALDPHAVDRVLRHLCDVLPPRSGINPLPEQVEPEETVVFLIPWKAGHRLYVKDSTGSQVGHLDLVRGTVECEEPTWQGVLERLLPHYCEADVTGTSTQGTRERRGVRAILGSLRGRPKAATPEPLIAACRWHNAGKHRLYIDRLDENGTKVNLGWFGLDDHYCHADDPRTRGVVAFCGSRFEGFNRKS